MCSRHTYPRVEEAADLAALMCIIMAISAELIFANFILMKIHLYENKILVFGSCFNKHRNLPSKCQRYILIKYMNYIMEIILVQINSYIIFFSQKQHIHKFFKTQKQQIQLF